MKNEQQQHSEYPYYDYDPEVWTLRVRVFGACLVGTIVILIACYTGILDDGQFWNVFILGSVTWMLLVTAWVQIGVAERQWKVMRESFSLTDDMFDLSERAYLAITDINIPGETFSYSLTDTFVFDLTNGGRTPAFEVRVKTNPTISTEEISDELMHQMMEGMKPIQILHELHLAGRTETFRFSIGEMLPNGANERWKSGEIRVYVPVRISYGDVHRDTQYLTYWYELIPNRHPVLRKPISYEVNKSDATKKRAEN